MRAGTRTVLFGTHNPLIHSLFVAWAWKRLYGFPWDPHLWVCFLVHDLGYLGKESLDGEDGQRHPELGARIAGVFGGEYRWLCLFHSRYYARLYHRDTSPLCRADKLAIALTPWWIYLPLAFLSGEVHEHMETSKRELFYDGTSPREWFALIKEHHRALSEHQQPPITDVYA